jgi:glycosyltransferase involved in cell wall biosynthesis
MAWTQAPLVVTLHDYSLVCAKKSLMYRDVPCSGPSLTKCLGCSVDHYGAVKGAVTMFGHRLAGMAERPAVDMFLPVSQAVADGNALAQSGLPYEVVPNFVPDNVGALPADAGARPAELPTKPYVLFVGNLTRIKGIHVLLQAYAGLVNAPPLVLIGLNCHDTPAEFPPNVIALRDCPHETVVRAWHESLFGVVPSIWPDPCPTVAMEAMATGRPVVATRMGGLPDLVDDGRTGYLVPPDDHVALRDAMQRLLDDPGLRREMGQAALEKVTHFQAGTVVPRIERVYQSLLGMTPPVAVPDHEPEVVEV